MEMGFGLDGFIKAAIPNTLYNVVEPQLLSSLMHGFFLHQHSGIILICDIKEDASNLLALCPLRGDKPYSFDMNAFIEPDSYAFSRSQNQFCREFRKRKEHRAKCFDSDCTRAKKTLNVSVGKTVHCPCHMGLDEWSFPIQLGNRTRGVLMAGQSIVRKEGKRGRKGLGHVINAIKTHAIQDDQETLIKCACEAAITKEKSNSIKETFDVFCEVVQRTVDALYKAKLETATETVSRSIHEHLSLVNTDSMVSWWNELEKLIGNLQVAASLQNVVIMCRRRSRYIVRTASSGKDGLLGSPLPVRYLIKWPLRQLVSVNVKTELAHVLEDHLPINVGKTMLFKNQLTTEHPLSTVVAIEGKIPEGFDELIKTCCEAISNRTDAFCLLQSLTEQQNEFLKSVTFSGHWLKTPLQNIMFALKEVEELPANNGETARKRDKLTMKARKQVKMALLDVLALRVQGIEKREHFDVCDVVKEILESEQLHSKRKSMDIKADITATPCKVQANRQKIRIALSNLVNNAIKFSYKSKYIDIRCKIPIKGKVIISISNYGTGFAKKDRERLFEIGERGDFKDDDYRAPHPSGWGVGLSQALLFIEENGGTLDIDSHPTTYVKGIDAGRHLTIATVTFDTRLDYDSERRNVDV